MNTEEQKNPQVEIENFYGDGFFIQVSADAVAPKIPEGMGRTCPQCGRETFLRARWCWYRDCAHDFDRATLPRFHSAKLLLASVILNFCLCAIVVLLIYTAHR